MNIDFREPSRESETQHSSTRIGIRGRAGLCHNPDIRDGEPKESHGKTIEEETTEHATAVQQVRAPFHGHGVVRFDRDP